MIYLPAAYVVTFVRLYSYDSCNAESKVIWHRFAYFRILCHKSFGPICSCVVFMAYRKTGHGCSRQFLLQILFKSTQLAMACWKAHDRRGSRTKFCWFHVRQPYSEIKVSNGMQTRTASGLGVLLMEENFFVYACLILWCTWRKFVIMFVEQGWRR
jgi:hypothetical protein